MSTIAPARPGLTDLGPVAQLRAGRLGRRLTQLYIGLVLYGVSLAMMVRADLGLAPWDVLHSGLAGLVPLTMGQVIVVLSFVVLLLWIPLRQWPGLGTVLNAVVIGVAIDATLAVVPEIEGIGWRVVVMLLAIAGNGVAGAMYIGSQLGPGPRDGLMTGLARRTGRSIRLVRTSLEVTVVVLGFALGGIVGVGTVLYALLIGPVVQFFLPRLTVRVHHPAHRGDAPADIGSGGSAVDGEREGQDARGAGLA
jgi:uncharacterized membrane protein YczE